MRLGAQNDDIDEKHETKNSSSNNINNIYGDENSRKLNAQYP